MKSIGREVIVLAVAGPRFNLLGQSKSGTGGDAGMWNKNRPKETAGGLRPLKESGVPPQFRHCDLRLVSCS